ncbi:MAG: hypothetical protein GWP14_00225 [Actinobacteria bacterium]|nr:hypothetical protein [Actinomycetota bacterium]
MINRTRMSFIILLVATACGLWFYAGRPATAQTFGSPTIVSLAVCDTHQVFRQYLKTKELRQALQSQSEQLRKDLESRDKQLRAKSEELAASSFAPGSQEYEQMRNALVKLSIEAKSLREISEAELRRQDMRITQSGYEDIYAAVAEVAKKKQLTIVLSQEQFSLVSARPEELYGKLYYRRPVLYSEKSLDITAEVIDLLNTKYKLGR